MLATGKPLKNRGPLMTYGVDFSEADGVAIIRLNRPEVLSAVDLETARALRSAVIAACDMAIAARDAVFSMAYCAIGGVPDSEASAAIAKLSNRKRAAELLLLGERFDAQEAKDLGLIGRIVEPDALDATTTALCDKLAAGPTWALGRAKQLLRSAETTPLETQLARERSAFVECVATADFGEGLKAFVDRRPPTFVGA
jgi:2-(1,2-epoxy-1,2-dihydrophenyl)acetyl-CoA isomerase